MTDGYELETLLQLRRQEKSDREEAYGSQLAELERCKRRVIEAEQKLKAAQEHRLSECRAFDDRLARGKLTFADKRDFDAYVEGLKMEEERGQEEIANARSAVDEQARQVERSRADLIEATRELKAVEKHREAWQHEQNQRKQRKESARMDDIAARLWREAKS